MENYYFIYPRQSGKTDKAVYEYVKDVQSNILLVLDERRKKEILNKYPTIYPNNIITEKEFITAPRKQNTKLVIVDDYNLFKEKHKIYTILKNNLWNYLITTSFYKQHDVSMFLFIKERKEKWSYSLISEAYEKINSAYDVEKFNELFYNPVTDSNVKIIDYFINRSLNTTAAMIGNQEIFDVEFINKWLI